MRKRLALLWTLVVVGAALALPAATFAGGPAQYTVLRNSCTNSGGSLGYGQSIMRVEQDEYGKSGVAQFRQRAWAQQKYGGKWHTVDSFSWSYSSWFGNNNTTHSYTVKFTFGWGSEHPSYYERLRWRGEWLSANGSVLYFQNLNGTMC